jgi:hypothetical protein
MLSISLQPKALLSIVCEACGVSLVAVKSGNRAKDIVAVKQIYSYFACLFDMQSTAHIPLGCDHATICYSRDKVTSLLPQKKEVALRMKVEKVKLHLKPYTSGAPCITQGRCRYLNGWWIPQEIIQKIKQINQPI